MGMHFYDRSTLSDHVSQLLPRTLLPLQLTERLKRRKLLLFPLSRTLQNQLRHRPHEEHIPLTDLLALRPHADPPPSPGADDNTRPIDHLKRRLRARPSEVGLHDAELLDGGVVERGRGGGGVGGGVEGHVGVVGGAHFLGGDGRVAVGEHGDEGGDVFELGGEAGADDVVRGGHALDYIAAEVGVDVVGLEEHCFTDCVGLVWVLGKRGGKGRGRVGTTELHLLA
jgi:hypothetical protein